LTMLSLSGMREARKYGNIICGEKTFNCTIMALYNNQFIYLQCLSTQMVCLPMHLSHGEIRFPSLCSNSLSSSPVGNNALYTKHTHLYQSDFQKVFGLWAKSNGSRRSWTYSSIDAPTPPSDCFTTMHVCIQ
jgi:hypothetical protein